MTVVLIAALALLAFAYVAVPLLVPGTSDPLPDERDPVLLELQEERDALFNAIRELDARSGLSAERIEELRLRYEAKAAKTLSAIDARKAELAGRRVAAPSGERRPRSRALLPVTVLAVFIAVAALLPTYVLPRVGQDATITTTDVDRARQLQALMSAAADDPTPANLVALGDFYVEVGQLDDARAAYLEAASQGADAPKGAFQRLAMIDLQTDLPASLEWLKRAREVDPLDPDTLTWLTEVAYALGDLPTALDAARSLAEVRPDGDPQAAQRLALLEDVAPLAEVAGADPSRENLLELADAFWRHGEQERAVDAYFAVLSQHDPLDVTALSRTGQVLLQAGRPEDAAMVISRAADGAGGLANLEPASQFALGRAHLDLGDYEAAGEALRAYLAGSPDDPLGAAVLLETAEARARGEEPAGPAAELALGQQVFAANCSVCHGATGAGGVGAQLAGSQRAANVANVTDAVRFGRGLMPAFQATLGADELGAVVAYVTQVLSAAGTP